MRPNNLITKLQLQRKAIIFITLAASGGLSYVVLPWIQQAFLPTVAGDAWLILPEHHVRIGAAAVVAMMVSSLGLLPMRLHWKTQDQNNNAPAPGWLQRIAQYRISVLTIFVTLTAFTFYFRSYAIVNTSGITQRKPWSTNHYNFDQIARLQMIPAGGRSTALRKNGPWFQVGFANGNKLEFSLDNESLTMDDLAALQVHVERSSGKQWLRVDDGYGTASP